jgi:hypothetical protein
MNGYQIVLIDGYDRLKVKCHGTAKHYLGAGTHFSHINRCYVDTNNVFTISRTNGYQIVRIDGYDRPKTKMPWDSKKLPPFFDNQKLQNNMIGNS